MNLLLNLIHLSEKVKRRKTENETFILLLVTFSAHFKAPFSIFSAIAYICCLHAKLNHVIYGPVLTLIHISVDSTSDLHTWSCTVAETINI